MAIRRRPLKVRSRSNRLTEKARKCFRHTKTSVVNSSCFANHPPPPPLWWMKKSLPGPSECISSYPVQFLKILHWPQTLGKRRVLLESLEDQPHQAIRYGSAAAFPEHVFLKTKKYDWLLTFPTGCQQYSGKNTVCTINAMFVLHFWKMFPFIWTLPFETEHSARGLRFAKPLVTPHFTPPLLPDMQQARTKVNPVPHRWATTTTPTNMLPHPTPPSRTTWQETTWP